MLKMKMKPTIAYFTITLIMFFAGCTPSVNRTQPEKENGGTVDMETQSTNPQVEDEKTENLEGAEMYIGKHLLTGIAYFNHKGEVTKRIQLHGKITRITKSGIFFERADGKGEFALPPDLTSLEPAIPGAEYTLKSTGEVVRNVDYISNWTIDPPSDKKDE